MGAGPPPRVCVCLVCVCNPGSGFFTLHPSQSGHLSLSLSLSRVATFFCASKNPAKISHIRIWPNPCRIIKCFVYNKFIWIMAVDDYTHYVLCAIVCGYYYSDTCILFSSAYFASCSLLGCAQRCVALFS